MQIKSVWHKGNYGNNLLTYGNDKYLFGIFQLLEHSCEHQIFNTCKIALISKKPILKFDKEKMFY